MKTKKSGLTYLTTGSRVRSHDDSRAVGFTYGTVKGIAKIGPWVKVLWDDGREMDCLAGALIAADATWPNHYHRCQWCGVLSECNDSCGQGGPHDPYTDSKDLPKGGERNKDGTFDGGYCDQECYDHKRLRGCQSNITEDGKVVDLTVPF